MTLTELANKHFTDKGTIAYEAHGYTEVYKDYIPSNRACTLLEIGVAWGDSIRMWNEYNPDMIVHGVDVNTSLFKPTGTERFVSHVGDQTDVKFLNDVMDQIPDVDFVIDDASHHLDSIFTSFKCIFPRLKSGAIYFIEDLHFQLSVPKLLFNKILEEFEIMEYKCPEIRWTRNQKLLIFTK